MAAIGGGVDRHIDRPLLQTALQDSLHRGVGLVILVKGQVVDEQNELLPPGGQRADQAGKAGEVLLLNLNEPQVLHAGQVEHGLDGS